MENYPQKNNTPWIVTACMTAAAAVLGYLYFDKKQLADQKEETIVQKAHELAFTKTKLDSVSTALDSKIAEVKMMGGKIDDLLAVKTRLEADKEALKKSGSMELAKFDKKIKEYESFLVTKDADINKYKEENQILTASNQTLQTTNQTLSTDVQALKTDKEVLTKTKQDLSDSVTHYTARNKELADKVSLGASLKAANVHVMAVKPNGKVIDKANYKASRVDKIKVMFNLPENPLTKLDDKEVIMRVLDPDGAVVSDAAVGSGKFNFKGQDMVYTTKQKVTYQNNNQLVEMLYGNTEHFRVGTYNIELYSEGFKIGTGSFIIK